MKKSILIAGIAAMAMVSCKKTEVTSENPAKVEVVDNDAAPITHDSTVNAVDSAAEKTRDNAGTAIKNGVNDVKDATNKAGSEIKDAAHNATDGDGKLTK